jgi:hypothetical protein
MRYTRFGHADLNVSVWPWHLGLPRRLGLLDEGERTERQIGAAVEASPSGSEG